MDKHQLLFKVRRSMLRIQLSKWLCWLGVIGSIPNTSGRNQTDEGFSILSKENPEALLQFLLFFHPTYVKFALSKSMMKDEHRIIPTE